MPDVIRRIFIFFARLILLHRIEVLQSIQSAFPLPVWQVRRLFVSSNNRFSRRDVTHDENRKGCSFLLKNGLTVIAD